MTISCHGSNGNAIHMIPVFGKGDLSPFIHFIDIRVPPCPIDVLLFFSGLFNVYVKPFNIRKWLWRSCIGEQILRIQVMQQTALPG